jgi:hypothetical protein
MKIFWVFRIYAQIKTLSKETPRNYNRRFINMGFVQAGINIMKKKVVQLAQKFIQIKI